MVSFITGSNLLMIRSQPDLILHLSAGIKERVTTPGHRLLTKPRFSRCSALMTLANLNLPPKFPPLQVKTSSLRIWRCGSVVKTTSCSFRGPRFDSQDSHGSSQPSLTPDPETPTPSPDLFRDHAWVWHKDMHESKTLIHIK